MAMGSEISDKSCGASWPSSRPLSRNVAVLDARGKLVAVSME